MPHITGKTPLQLWEHTDTECGERAVFGNNEDVIKVDPTGPFWTYTRVDEWGEGREFVLPSQFAKDCMTPAEAMQAFKDYDAMVEPVFQNGWNHGRQHGRREIRTALAGLIGADAINMAIRGEQ